MENNTDFPKIEQKSVTQLEHHLKQKQLKIHKKSKKEETIEVTNILVNEIDNAQNEKQKKVYT